MKIGVLGGTFDPIHNGHLLVAKEVMDRVELAEIIFVPAGQPWLKAGNPISPAKHRVEMVRLAIVGEPRFRLSTVEIDRPGPTYTVDTIAQLKAQFGSHDELFFIMGMDNLSQLPRWHEPPRLVKLCYLVAVPRPGYSLPDVKSLETVIPGLTPKLILLDKPEVDIDSTEARERVALGLSISHLVPKPVEEYIQRHRLYRRQVSPTHPNF